MRWAKASVWLLAGLPGSALAQSSPPDLPPVNKPPTTKGDPTPPKGKPPKFEPNKTTTTETSVNDPSKKKKKNTLGSFISEQILKRVEISGSRRLAYHSHRVEGDREAFNLNTTYGLGEKRFTDVGSIFLQGRKVLGIFNFEAVIQDNRFQDPQGQRFSLDYAGNGWSVNLGDIRGRLLDSNRFVTFNKSLRGGMVGYKSNGFEAKALITEARGEARTVTISGTNSSGPYYLQSNQILRGSEEIALDGVPQEFGADYIIDYDLGSITFINRSSGQAKIIPPTSVITATYESLGFSGSKGQVIGAGATYDMGRFGKIGLSVAGQRVGGESRLSSRLEKFQGFGAPGTPYFLQFEPLAGEAVVIRVDGILQTENVDYTFDAVNKSIFYFTRFMPSTSTIDVVYTPRPTQTVNGDRQVVGIDYRLQVAPGATITLTQASSRLTNTPTPRSGTAQSAEFRYDRGKLKGYGSVRSVPDGYAGIETIGFNRNEKSSDLSVQYQLAKGLQSGLRFQNSAISQTTFDANGDEKINPTRFTLSQLSFDFTPSGKGSPWNFVQARSGSRTINGLSQTDTSTLSTSKNFGRLETRVELSNLLGIAPSNIAGQPRQKLSRQGLDLRGSYRADERLSATFSAGLSRVSLEGDSGVGRDLQLGLGWRANPRTQVNFNYTDTDSGNVNQISGFSSGYGFGYGGNGFSSGSGGSPIIGVASQRRLSLSATTRPRDGLSFGAGLSLARSQGSISSNTETATLGFNADWEATRWLQITGTAGLNSSKYLDSDQSSRALSFSFSVDGAPKGRFTFGFGATGLLSSGGEFGQDVLQFDGRMSYQPLRRHRFSFLVSGSQARGYLPQDDYDLGLAYRYEIWNGLALSLTHRWRRVTNRDTDSSSGAYTSRGFDLELGFNFGR